MIVSRSVLKEMRSKHQKSNIKGRQQFSASTSKKSAVNQQQHHRQRCPLKEMYEFQNSKGDLNFKQKGQGFLKKVNKFKVQNDFKAKDREFQSEQKQSRLLLSLPQRISPQINLSRNSIKQLKFDFRNELSFRQIKQLNLSHNQIRQILPTILVPFQFLQYLDLSDNKLQKISFPYNKMALKQLKITRNKLANLNLQHLKYLQNIDASNNKLIFITLSQAIKNINLDHNMLANTYFIEKCSKVQKLSINFNFIYDLNFNSMSELDNGKNQNCEKARFNCLTRVECSNNKVCHLNGFQNLTRLQVLQMDNNELSLSRENVNQLLMLQNIQHLSIEGNPEQGVYSFQQFQKMLFDKFPNIKSLNQKQKDTIIPGQKNNHNKYNNYEQDNFQLFQSSRRKQDINDESTIQQNQFSMECSGQKPFRLFLNDQSSQKYNSTAKPQQNCQRIYTLGDMDDKVQENSDFIFQQMTVSNKMQENDMQPKCKVPQVLYEKPDFHQSDQKQTYFQKSNKKIQQFEKELSKSSSRILIPLQKKQIKSQTNFQITIQTRNLLKIIYEMSFIPPQPLKYSSNSLLISKRLDEDEDQYYLFTKLFEKSKGILYLKKIFLLEEDGLLFQDNDSQTAKQYELGFFNAPNSQEIYKKMIKNDCLLTDLIDVKMQSNLANYLSPIPGAFGCHHIVVRHLIKKASAFDKRNLTPVCYLIESKII